MVINNILFKNHLNYQIQAKTEEQHKPAEDNTSIKAIDLHYCYFSEYKRAMEYIRDNSLEFDFSDFSIDAVKPAPADFSEDKKYNFIELIDYAKHTAITIGNMALFNELQKIQSAAEKFNFKTASPQDQRKATIMSFDAYNNYEIKTAPSIFDELGSCVVSSIEGDPIKLTATYHASSTPERPIISVRSYSLTSNTYSSNIDIIDFDAIYKPNATIMETFAYMSYYDHAHNKFNHSFDKIMYSDTYSIDTIEDMYSSHYDLRTFDYLYK